MILKFNSIFEFHIGIGKDINIFFQNGFTPGSTATSQLTKHQGGFTPCHHWWKREAFETKNMSPDTTATRFWIQMLLHSVLVFLPLRWWWSLVAENFWRRSRCSSILTAGPIVSRFFWSWNVRGANKKSWWHHESSPIPVLGGSSQLVSA